MEFPFGVLQAMSIVAISVIVAIPAAFHTASSFLTNTDQQHYSGDTFSPIGQALVITTLMFFSAATGYGVCGMCLYVCPNGKKFKK